MVRFGLQTGLEECTMSELAKVWRQAEDLGFEWVSVWDHLYPSSGDLSGRNLDAVVCHSALAATTSRVRVGSLVYSAGFRHPAVLANAMASIDQLSGGRLEFGIGTGWLQAEYDAFGLPFDPPAAWIRRLREAVEVIRALWSSEVTDYAGEFYQLRGAYCSPKPLQAAPRIWVGAAGERGGLQNAARIADGWNCPAVSPADFARKRSILLDAARDPGRIETGVTVGLLFTGGNREAALAEHFGHRLPMLGGSDGFIAGSVEQVRDAVGSYAAAGADWVIVRQEAPFDVGALERFAGEIVPEFTGIKGQAQ